MGEIRATAPSGFQRADFKACLNVFGPFSERSCDENRMAFTMESMENTKRNRVLIKGSIPTMDAVVPEVSQELIDRENCQASSHYQSLFFLPWPVLFIFATPHILKVNGTHLSH